VVGQACAPVTLLSELPIKLNEMPTAAVRPYGEAVVGVVPAEASKVLQRVLIDGKMSESVIKLLAPPGIIDAKPPKPLMMHFSNAVFLKEIAKRSAKTCSDAVDGLRAFVAQLEDLERAPTKSGYEDAIIGKSPQSSTLIDGVLRTHSEQTMAVGMKKRTECSFCHAEAPLDKPLSKCARCKVTRYCSRDCQKAHW
jgi:hypothetical protein